MGNKLLSFVHVARHAGQDNQAGAKGDMTLAPIYYGGSNTSCVNFRYRYHYHCRSTHRTEIRYINVVVRKSSDGNYLMNLGRKSRKPAVSKNCCAAESSRTVVVSLIMKMMLFTSDWDSVVVVIVLAVGGSGVVVAAVVEEEIVNFKKRLGTGPTGRGWSSKGGGSR